MLGLIKRYRELFAIGVLLVLPLATYLTYSRSGRELNAADRAIIWASGPIERGLTSSVGWLVDHWNEWVALRAVREQNVALLRENQQLRQDVARVVEAQAENERLRRMIGYAETAAVPLLTAPIIGEGPALNLLTVKIGKGSNDGILKGMAVASSDGVVGRVLNVGPRSADVLLLADTNFAVPVRVQRSRARAKVMGQGARALPALVQALRTDDILEGDVLVTSGTDGVFPKGLVVGRVVNLARPGVGMFQSADVVLAVDVVKLEEVFVLMGLPGREDLPAAALPQP